MKLSRYLVSSFLVFAAMPANAAQDSTKDLLSLSLSELGNIVVTSVSKRETNYEDSAAALYVISNEEIKRSGATSIPEALRLVPGLSVARSTGSQWAITSRGFNSQFANKLLVMIDGRSIYTPLFSGVFWDTQDTLLEDIERIEVIRGPAATLWGANAVDGVINIITRKSYDTRDNYATLLVGNGERQAAFRHGEGDADSAWRAYGKVSDDSGESPALASKPSDDDIKRGQAGFRKDWKNGGSEYTVQGDIYRDRRDTSWYLPALTSPFYGRVDDEEHLEGANILGRWNKATDNGDTTLQAYIDYVSRDNIIIRQRQLTLDLDFQKSSRLNDYNNVIWGAGFRNVSDNNDGSYYINFSPDDRNMQIYSAFIQDDISITDNLTFTPGSKFEWNSFTGFEVQPSARLMWKPVDEHRLWMAAARSIRSVDRAGDDMHFITAVDPTAPAFVKLNGSDGAKAEEMWSLEVGHRYLPSRRFTIDSAAYYNIYDRITGYSLGTPFVETSSPLPPHVVVPANIVNELNATIYGAEINAEYQATSDWKLALAYTLAFAESRGDGGWIMTDNESSPQHQIQAKSFWNITPDVKWDVFLYYVDNIPTADVDAYLKLDSRIAWQMTSQMEFSLVGQGLLDSSKQEFSAFVYNAPMEIDRRFYGQLTWRF